MNKIVFIGSVEFSAKALKRIVDAGGNVVAVISREDTGFNSDYANLQPVAQKMGIDYYTHNNINSKESIETIQSYQPDLICCFGWSYLLKRQLLNIPRIGVLGYHPSALPLNRGRHPNIWAMVLGLHETASSFFMMEEGADTGDIVSQEKIKIEYQDNARSLYDKTSKVALSQITHIVKEFNLKGDLPKRKQDHSLANTWRKRSAVDGQIDFRMSKRAIYNLVRAISEPYPGATIQHKNGEMIVYKCEELDNEQSNYEHGKVLEVAEDSFTVKCYDGAVKFTRFELNGVDISNIEYF
jgi:methionyl-tRNA formyltransferase